MLLDYPGASPELNNILSKAVEDVIDLRRPMVVTTIDLMYSMTCSKSGIKALRVRVVSPNVLQEAANKVRLSLDVTKIEAQPLLEIYKGTLYISKELRTAFGLCSKALTDLNLPEITVDRMASVLCEYTGAMSYGLAKACMESPDDYIQMNREIKQIKSKTDESPLYIDKLKGMRATAGVATNLTKLACDGKLDKVIGRETELLKAFEVLGRRRKNNACLIGAGGVGKTAIVEGMAQMIVDGKAPAKFSNHTILSINIPALTSGTKYRGDFERKFNEILREVTAEKDIILFFDEMHQIVQAGACGNEGDTSAADILKPALARGELCVIGATTVKEYRKTIEADEALDRRFEAIVVREPSIKDSIKIVSGVANEYAKYHHVEIPEAVIKEAVLLSERYITSRKLPDKAISLLDDAASSLVIGRGSGITSNKEPIVMTEEHLRSALSKSTGINVMTLEGDSRKVLESLSSRMKDRLVGQDEAVEAVVKAIRRNKAGVRNAQRPVGTFLFVGPTGVGKTELCKVLAEEYNGNAKSLIRLDMSEYSDKFTVSKLIGSPPGYVGYGEGGHLTEAVKRMPYAIILLDEIEKAHDDIYNLLLQVLDDGRLTDSRGDIVDFKNTIIIMTSNVGHSIFGQRSKALGFTSAAPDQASKAVSNAATNKELEKHFRPEFINRIDKIVVFNQLTEKEMNIIVNINMQQLRSRLLETGVKVTWDQKLTTFLATEGANEKYGARQLSRVMQSLVEDRLADLIIEGNLDSRDTIKFTIKDNKILAKVVKATHKKELVTA